MHLCLFPRTTLEYLEGEVKDMEKRIHNLEKDLKKTDKELQKQYRGLLKVRDSICIILLSICHGPRTTVPLHHAPGCDQAAGAVTPTAHGHAARSNMLK